MIDPKKTTLVIDFDGTLTALPAFWRSVLELANTLGHRVICMTQRICDESNVDEVDSWLTENKIEIPVYYTNRASKVLELERMGITNYILCDDNPRRAVNGV